jgi:ribosomal protein S18 acetylase RimI-like enzyme
MKDIVMKYSALGRNDIDAIQPLWEKLNAEHLSKSTYFKNHYANFTFEKRMKGLYKKEHLIAYTAEDNGEKIGYCIATADENAGEIDSIYINEEYRGKGVGKELILLALKWLENLKCETIRVSIAEGNEAVFDFYKKLGFAERLTVMQKRE